MEFPSQVKALHVSFRPPAGHVTPIIIGVGIGHPGKGIDDLSLQVEGMQLGVTLLKGVSDIVEGILEEGRQFIALKREIRRVSQEGLAGFVHLLQLLLQSLKIRPFSQHGREVTSISRW